jgi:hypothetical protein
VALVVSLAVGSAWVVGGGVVVVVVTAVVGSLGVGVTVCTVFFGTVVLVGVELPLTTSMVPVGFVPLVGPWMTRPVAVVVSGVVVTSDQSAGGTVSALVGCCPPLTPPECCGKEAAFAPSAAWNWPEATWALVNVFVGTCVAEVDVPAAGVPPLLGWVDGVAQ